MSRKVTKRELRDIFNDPAFRADALRRTNQRIELSQNLASVECNQEPGTTSHVYEWREYDASNDRTRLLVTYHVFKKPDGTIGASGQPDPIIVVVDEVPHIDP